MWQEILTTALVGSERQQFKLADGSADSPLQKMLRQLAENGEQHQRDRAEQLLDLAATVSLYREIGQLPKKNNLPLPEPCDLNDLPEGDESLNARLDQLFDNLPEELLFEWLAAIADAGKRVPSGCLPKLLEVGRKNEALRARIIPVLGKRGGWLASFNDKWGYAGSKDLTEENLSEKWQTEQRDRRLAILKRLRIVDADAALELLSSNWVSESAEDRFFFIKMLEHHLSIKDEPFLEAALDDRRKEVRKAAAELLKKLPESKLIERMIARAAASLQFQRTAQSVSIELQLPADCDTEMLRDGIEAKPDNLHKKLGLDKNLGERAWWLKQNIAAVPPRHWSNRWSATPVELIEAAIKSDWKDLLIESWQLAAELHPDSAWAEALLQINPDNQALFDQLPAARAEALIVAQLDCERASADKEHPAMVLLAQYCRPWSIELARMVFARIYQQIIEGHNWQAKFLFNGKPGSGDSKIWEIINTLKSFALYIPPSLFDEWAEILDSTTKNEDWAYWVEAVQEFVKILEFRVEMLEEIEK